MDSLADFLRKRFKEIERELDALDEKRRVFEAEKADIQKAASAANVSLNDLNNFDGMTPNERLILHNMIGAPVDEVKPRKRKTISNLTIKEAVLLVLESAKKPTSALSILDLISLFYGVEIERTSLSPQLTRLKSDGLVELTGKDWSLTDAGHLMAIKLQHQYERLNKLPPP